MPWRIRSRQIHRWAAVTLTLTMTVTVVALLWDDALVWVSYVPLLPLAVLLVTGLYLFALPHATRWRTARDR